MTSRDEILKQKPKEGYKFIYRYYDDYGSYIGQTKKSLKERAGKDGKSYLTTVNKWSDAIREKGIEHFNVEILEECLESEANRLEKEYIKKFNSRTNGYNSTWGGKSYNPDAIIDSKYKVYYELGLDFDEISLIKSNKKNWIDVLPNDTLFDQYSMVNKVYKYTECYDCDCYSEDTYYLYKHNIDDKCFMVRHDNYMPGGGHDYWVLQLRKS